MSRLFLLDQRLSAMDERIPPGDRRRYVTGSETHWGADPRDTQIEAWRGFTRDECRTAAVSEDAAWQRVAVVCDAGLGKTTNLQWLAAQFDDARSSRLPVLLRMDDAEHLELLMRAGENPERLLDHIVSEVASIPENGRDRSARDRLPREVSRLRDATQVTLILDGLDHGLIETHVVRRLAKLLTSAWRHCPVWVAGRPYAFDRTWDGLIDAADWRFVRVEPLAEPEIRFYLTREAGGDWYDDIAAKELLAVPRLLRLVADILRAEADAARRRGADPRAAVRALGLDTPADVYSLAYFTPGQHLDPAAPSPAALDRRGLLAQGLTGESARIGLARDDTPTPFNHWDRIERTAALLGAIAFEMFAESSADPAAIPEPNTAGVRTGPAMTAFRRRVRARLRAADPDRDGLFENDFRLLTQMNTRCVDFLLFRELGEQGLAWHDRTAQSFFASFWAMTHGTPDDRAVLRRWVTGPDDTQLEAFDEFWQFAAELPDDRLDRARWREVFGSCFTPPAELTGPHEFVQWHRRMVHHGFRRMRQRFPGVVTAWMAPPEVQREIQAGLVDIPAGICHFGADPVRNEPGVEIDVSAFRLGRHPVTNELYERFAPQHEALRWATWRDEPEPHPLGKGRGGKARVLQCPVICVTWYDAWCMAAWCGCRLPTEQEWEHACRAGTRTRYSFGDDEADLSTHAWFNANSESSTHPVGLKPEADHQHPHGLTDMHGNVWEWCDSRWQPGGSDRVYRGGGWSSSAGYCRSAYRGRISPAYRNLNLGFRLAAVPSGRTRRRELDR